MKYVFSTITNAFFPLVLQAVYESAGTWPADVVEVDDAVYDEIHSRTVSRQSARYFRQDAGMGRCYIVAQ